jgi:DeoR family glycerol-3-phosphate regulon repressor
MKGNQNSKTRRKAILRGLHQDGRALVDDLAERFETTPQTIRKDLNILAEAGRVMRFHGGASLLAGTDYIEFDARKQIAREQKRRIGQTTARQIPDNTAILLNAGTTTVEVALGLGNHLGLKIIVDNVSVANEIKAFTGAEVIVPGGLVRPSDGAVLGESAVEFIRQFRADVAVIGVAAIAPDGALLDYDLREAAVARAIVASARHVILAADSSKYERLAPVSFGHLGQVRTLVTDHGCSADLRRLCHETGTGLVLAG